MPTDVKLKEAFVSGHSGTSWLEILLITCVFPCGRIMFALGCKAFRTADGTLAQQFVGGLTILLPTLLACWRSNMSDIAMICVATLTSLAVLLSFMPPITPASGSTRNIGWIEAAKSMHSHPKTYITTFRAGLTAYTCIAILAVDFPYFPRRLAKAETFGTGLMDLGPGLYVFSFGLMLGLRMQREVQKQALSKQVPERIGSKHGSEVVKGSSGSGSMRPAALLMRAAGSVGPLAALGVARLILTKTVEYQEHQSEYGVHWNFFFTLASVACFTALLPLSGANAAAMTVMLTSVYQGLLLLPGWTDWLAGDERDQSSLFDSNKEGFMSLFGYAALCNAGAATAALLDENKRAAEWLWDPVQKVLNRMGVSARSGVADVVAWHSTLSIAVCAAWVLVFMLDGFVQPVSRRFANAAYVVWVLALALMQVQLSSVAEMVSAVIAGVHARPHCSLVHELSKNQLAAFLVANVATGAVNLSVDTLGASEGLAFTIMVVYCLSWGYIGCWIDLATSAWAHRLQQVPGKNI